MLPVAWQYPIQQLRALGRKDAAMKDKKKRKDCFGYPVQESDDCNECSDLDDCVYKLWDEGREKQSKRTVREFVEDCLSDGRTGKEILVVAKMTYWKSKIEEVKEVIKSFSKKLKKTFQIIGKDNDNRVKGKK